MYCNTNHGQGCQKNYCRKKNYYSNGYNAYCLGSTNASKWDNQISHWEPLSLEESDDIIFDYIMSHAKS